MKFYSASRKKLGRQSLKNRIKAIFEEITEPVTLNETNDQLRLLLKRSFNFIKFSDTSFQIAGNKSKLKVKQPKQRPDPNPDKGHVLRTRHAQHQHLFSMKTSNCTEILEHE